MKIDPNKILILSGKEIDKILAHKQEQIMKVVEQAYTAHEKGESSLPHSVFLHFADKPRNRIIGLPAYVGGDFPVAGIKWIASFPSNIKRGIDRASATIILNSIETGRAYSIMEGSIISAKRTAASAALAAMLLVKDKKQKTLSLVGCGLINFEIFKFITPLFKDIETIYLYDTDPLRAKQFAEKIKKTNHFEVVLCRNIKDLLNMSKLVSFATTSSVPYIEDLSLLQNDSLYLHISLRDLGPEIIHQTINIVDDIDHVNRENTSIHLATQKFDNTDFVVATLGKLLLKKILLPSDPRPVIFSPFGLGILDMAVANYVYNEALQEGLGVIISDFFPKSWIQRI